MIAFMFISTVKQMLSLRKNLFQIYEKSPAVKDPEDDFPKDFSFSCEVSESRKRL